jgi:hypothetical protein
MPFAQLTYREGLLDVGTALLAYSADQIRLYPIMTLHSSIPFPLKHIITSEFQDSTASRL